MNDPVPVSPAAQTEPKPAKLAPNPAKEVGGRPGPEPTRYGDWESRGIVSDF